MTTKMRISFFIMKKLFLCFLCTLLCGCGSFSGNALLNNRNSSENLTLAVSANSSDLIRQIARELVLRAEDLTNNSLAVEIVEVENVWELIQNGGADLLICENSLAVSDANSLQKIQYPVSYIEDSENKYRSIPVYEQLQGDAAMFAMMEYPFFFKNSDAVVKGANNPDFLSALNYSLPQDYSMRLQRITYGGCYHWVTEPNSPFFDFFSEKDEFSLISDLSVGYSARDFWRSEKAADFSFFDLDLTKPTIDLNGKVLLLSSQKMKLIDIFSNSKSISELSPAQQAAIQEAIVYCGGYSKILAENEQDAAFTQFEEEFAQIQKLNSKRLYEAFFKFYLSQNRELNPELIQLLYDKIKYFE